jgi:thioredoxin-like negative regulator of GroEL
VNGLAQEYKGDLYVTYIDIDDPANRALVNQYGATAIPLMVVLNDQGEISSVFRGLTLASLLRSAIDQALRESTGSAAVRESG